MNVDLFEYEMKKAGFRTPTKRAEAMGISLSAYYKRINKERECTKKEIDRIADLLGRDVMLSIFFEEKVS